MKKRYVVPSGSSGRFIRQRTLQARGLTLASAVDESSTGPASIMLIAPDGDPLLIAQHVPKPER